MRVAEQRKAVKRFIPSYVSKYNLLAWDVDNLYPQHLSQLINASATGSSCVDRYANYIEGNGITDLNLAKIVINRGGTTIDELHHLLSQDLAKFGGFALHVNYDLTLNISEINFVPFENCRLEEPDEAGYIGHILLHPDWSEKTTRSGKLYRVNEATIDKLNIFNPDKRVVAQQILTAGGLEFYKGQIFYCSNSGVNTYPLPKADKISTELSTDEGLSNVKNRNVRNNFLPAGMIVHKRGTNAPAEFTDSAAAAAWLQSESDEFAQSVVNLQGDMNACKLLDVTIESDEDKPEFLPINAQNYDNVFTVTTNSTIESIYAAFGQEGFFRMRNGSVGFSTDIIEAVKIEYAQQVTREQRQLTRAYNKIFNGFAGIANPNFEIEPIIKSLSTNGTAL